MTGCGDTQLCFLLSSDKHSAVELKSVSMQQVTRAFVETGLNPKRNLKNTKNMLTDFSVTASQLMRTFATSLHLLQHKKNVVQY